MNEYKISVIIPTYKPQAYIWECLDSMKNQTFPHDEFEVILVLNGAREPFYMKIEKYIKDTLQGAVNIKLFYSELGNVSNARNIGLDNASGEYIVFIDDDDYVSESYLSALFLKASKEIIPITLLKGFCDDNTLTEEEVRQYNSIKEQRYQEHYLKGKAPYKTAIKYFSSPVMKMIHKDIIGGRRFNLKFKNGEDALFMFSISDIMRYVDFATNDAIYYRRHRNGSLVNSGRSRAKKMGNAMRLSLAYSSIFFSAPFRYSFSFYVNRVMAVFKGALIG